METTGKDTGVLIEWEQFEMMGGFDSPELLEIYDDLVSEFPHMVQELCSFLDKGDAEQAMGIAHQLKGSCSNFGLRSMSIYFLDLEASLEAGSHPATDVITIEANAIFQNSDHEIRQRLQ